MYNSRVQHEHLLKIYTSYCYLVTIACVGILLPQLVKHNSQVLHKILLLTYTYPPPFTGRITPQYHVVVHDDSYTTVPNPQNHGLVLMNENKELLTWLFQQREHALEPTMDEYGNPMQTPPLHSDWLTDDVFSLRDDDGPRHWNNPDPVQHEQRDPLLPAASLTPQVDEKLPLHDAHPNNVEEMEYLDLLVDPLGEREELSFTAESSTEHLEPEPPDHRPQRTRRPNRQFVWTIGWTTNLVVIPIVVFRLLALPSGTRRFSRPRIP